MPSKIAIEEAITADIARAQERAAAGEDVDMEDEAGDPVPELTKAYFEEASADGQTIRQ